MRWRYCETEPERERRDTLLERIDRFWADVAAATDALPTMSPDELGAWMDARLAAIHPGIMFELRVSRGGKHGLVVTAEDDLSLRRLVVEMVARAPSIPGWELFDDRVAVPADDAVVLVQARNGFDISAWRVVPAVSDGRIHLTYVSPDAKHADDDHAWAAAVCATQNLLGERRTAQWIGVIRVVPAQRRPALLMRKAPNPEAEGAVSLAELAPSVASAIEELERALPSEPLWAAPAGEGYRLIGHSFERTPKQADDYPGITDVFTGFTRELRVLQAVLAAPFFSSSHSRCGETFCYVKLERADPNDTDLSPRHALENALDDALQGVGVSIGGATGLRYSYIDLALTDLERSLERVRDVLRAHDLPARSWILFHDAELANEWLGVYPDTPPPPSA